MKKSLSLLLAIALVFSAFSSLAFAADQSVAEKLVNAGVIKGTLSGDLKEDETWKRQDVTVIIARLMGKETEAQNTAKNHTFADVTDPYYDGFITWGKENGYFKGTSDVRFGYNDAIEVQEFLAVMLRVLGYDVAWGDVPAKAVELGLIQEGADMEAEAVRGEYFVILDTTLQTPNADGEKLGEKLGLPGYVSEQAAVKSVAAVGAKKIKVEFTAPVDKSKAEIEVKYGFLTQEVTANWADDNKSVVLESENNYIAGDYTVTIKGLGLATETYSLKIEAEKLVSFTIATDMLTAVVTQTVKIAPVNQYGEEFSLATAGNFTATAMNVTDGTAVVINATGNNEFTIATDLSAQKDDTVVVTIAHNTSGISQSMTYKVMAASYVDSIQLSAPSPKKDKSRIETNDATDELILPITLINQYGKTVDLTSTVLTNDLQFISSNTAIVDPANFGVNSDGKLTFRTGATSGSVTITAIAKKSGKTATVTFQVDAPATLKQVTLQSPTGLVVAGEAIEIPYTAVDSYGAATKLTAVNNLVWFSTDPTKVDVATDIAVDAKGKLTITPDANAAAGTVTVSAFLNGAKQGDIVLNVNVKAVPSKISKLKDDSISVFNQVYGEHTYGVGDFEIRDQYNRVMDAGALNNANLTITVKDSSTNVVGVTAGRTVKAANDQTGSKTLTATYNVGGGVTITKDFTVTVISDNDVTGYKLTDIANKLLRSSSWASAAAAGNYARSFVIEHGLTADGKKVALSNTDKADILLISSNTAAVAVDGTSVYAVGTSNDEKATVTAWKRGTKIAEVEFTTSNAVPVISSLAFDAESVTVAKGSTVNVYSKLTTKKDQYGVDIPFASNGGNWMTTKPGIATVDANGVVTGVEKGEAVITVVAPNGTNASIKVIVE